MKKTLYALALLTVLLLPSVGHSQEPSDNGTVPPYTLWLPMVGDPVVCEDPGLTDWGYMYSRWCRVYPNGNTYCWLVRKFYVSYYNGGIGGGVGYARVKGDKTIHELYHDGYVCGVLCFDYPIEPDTTYDVSFKVMCADQTWSNWSDWKEIVVPAVVPE